MVASVRARVQPNDVRSGAILSTIAVIAVAAGWILATFWSVMVASTQIDRASHVDHSFIIEDPLPFISTLIFFPLWAGFLLSGLLWAVWQRSVALVAAAGEGVRDPEWHARAWFSSIVMWWEPLRNMRELTSYFLPGRRRWLVPAWWAAWVAFRITCWLVIWQISMPASGLLQPVPVAVVSVLATLFSTTLAVMVIWTVTSAVHRRVKAPFTVQYVPKPVRFSLGLFIIGIICRFGTPVAVMVFFSTGGTLLLKAIG